MAIDTVVEEVAANLEEAAEATRQINASTTAWFLGGVAVGVAVGFYWGYKFNKKKIRAEAFKQSEEEIEKIREMYQQKVVASEPKPSAEDLVQERGYLTTAENPQARLLKPPVPGVVDATPLRPHIAWDWGTEVAGRLEGEPYVIHQDEWSVGVDGYNKVTYTYYEVDDVLVDEENGHPLPHGDLVVGLNNLQFGHGTDDPDVVFVRNDKMELEMEICRVKKSFEEEVLGIGHDDDATDDD